MIDKIIDLGDIIGMPMGVFHKTKKYLMGLTKGGDELDKMVARLVASYQDANRVRKALDERFNKGAQMVPGVDRGGRKTKIRRVGGIGARKYLIEGSDGKWYEPEEKVWAYAMFELYRK